MEIYKIGDINLLFNSANVLLRTVEELNVTTVKSVK